MKFLPAILSIAFALVSIQAFGTTKFHFQAARLDVSVELKSRGMTRLILAPLGEIRSYTHSGPVAISVLLRSIDLDRLTMMSKDPPSKAQLVNEVEKEAISAAKLLVAKLVLLAFAGGCVGAYSGGWRRPKSCLSGGLVGVVLFTVLLGVTVKTYKAESFNSPEYTGAMEAAPFVVDMVQNGIDKVDELGDRIAAVSDNLFSLYSRLELLKPLASPDADLNILHVSDIHNNPTAWDLIRQVVRTFKVDAIIDSGDITDWGTELETAQLEQIAGLDVPYIFIPGNHDSPDVLEKLSAVANVKVLQATEVNVKGLRILGLGDPNSASNAIIAVADKQAMATYQTRLAAMVGSDPPMITVVHNKKTAQKIIGHVPLILHGHDHQLKLSVEDGTVMVDAGSTGAEGIRGLEVKKGFPYSLALLHFSLGGEAGNPKAELVAVDTIKVMSLSSGFTMGRQIFLKDLIETKPAVSTRTLAIAE